jgi:uncharacterized MAPEG superfamily protein
VTIDLTCLVINALWGLVLVFIEIGGKTRAGGTAWNAGNRETEPDVPAWVQRAGRALSNHKENFPLFLTAVIVVHLAHESDRLSGIAAIVYVVARALHGLLYVGGVKGLRSVVFTIGTGSVLVILSRLLV